MLSLGRWFGSSIDLALCAALSARRRRPGAELGPPVGAIAMHGEPALPADFAHLPYVNPDAPKGGRLNLAYLGAFDSLNPYNVKSLSTAEGLIGNVYQSLMARSDDEPFTLYGLIAESIETDAARDVVVFHLNPAAHFSDGSPITSADVVFTFNLLKAKGRPQQRAAFSLVRSVDAPDERTVRFDLSGAERPRAAADPGVDAGAVPRPHRRRAFRGPDPADSDRLGALSGRRGEAWRAARARSATRTTGAGTCRSKRASTISIRSASTTSATRTRCSRRSRPA